MGWRRPELGLPPCPKRGIWSFPTSAPFGASAALSLCDISLLVSKTRACSISLSLKFLWPLLSLPLPRLVPKTLEALRQLMNPRLCVNTETVSSEILAGPC